MTNRPIIRHLTTQQVRDHGEEICSAIRSRADAWGLRSWAFVGKSPRIRLEVRVFHKRPAHTMPVEALSVRGLGRLKPSVAASYGGGARPVAGGGGPSADSFAPGVPVFVGANRARVGVATLLDVDGRLHLLTCGHGFGSGQGDDVFHAKSSQRPIARLARNWKTSGEPLDAAICELTDAGKDRLAASLDEPTWFTTVHTPKSADNGRAAVFYPTNQSGLQPFEENVLSFSACTDVLFGGGGPNCGFVELQFPAQPGDSGSILALGDRAYALCSGRVDHSFTYLTPIASVLARAQAEGMEVRLWTPDDGIF